MRFDVVGFGALNLDKLFNVNLIAKKEEEGFITGFKEFGGGSAANTTVGLARLELKTGFIGKVANDREGKQLITEFIREKVDVNGIKVTKSGRSGTVMGYIDPHGDRALYVDPGVNDQLDINDVDLEYMYDTKFLHLSSFVGDKPFKTQKQVITKLLDVKVSFDPGALYSRKGFSTIKPILKRSFALFPNKKEVKLLTGLGYKEGTQKLLSIGAEIVAVKLGKRGCYINDGKESYLIDAYKVDAVDTTGAGDAFCAGFIYGLIKGNDLFDCGKLGNFVASRCVSAMGARTGLPHLGDLKRV
jgi:ribokinase